MDINKIFASIQFKDEFNNKKSGFYQIIDSNKDCIVIQKGGEVLTIPNNHIISISYIKRKD